jgi:LysM repeat protein
VPSIGSKGARIKKILSNWLFEKKASFSFAGFLIILLPAFIGTQIANSDTEAIFSPESHIYNSQTVAILSPKFQFKGPTGGPDEIMTDDNALLANGNPIADEDVERVIKSSSDDISVYIVREGDTLSEIAEMFDVKVATIRGFNNIRKDSDLRVGMELLILPIDGLVHKVEKGETLSSIAKKYKSDEGDIALFNDIGSDGKLEVGGEIIIPNGEMPQVATTTRIASKSTPKSSGSSLGYDTYPAGFYSHPIPRGSVKSQGFHGPYQAQDLAAPTGTTVVASSAGTVIAVRHGWSGG